MLKGQETAVYRLDLVVYDKLWLFEENKLSE